ncbi:hypothetical protein ILUMI_19408 [Ignelater luminosus]|uniref:Uncharacterized protein n=1 Tax=Ignelater luminosus TaxID=2038154 RepID=A0A8K0CN53_IGNLU|nr:hypothetical protein ILUMI_19408 [Ignelater luminosus]
MTHNVCREMKEDHFGIAASLSKSVNVKIQCPLKKGWLNITNGMIDFTKFPPHIPRGQYMDQLTVYDGSNFIGEIQVEAVVEDIIKKWEN